MVHEKGVLQSHDKWLRNTLFFTRARAVVKADEMRADPRPRAVVFTIFDSRRRQNAAVFSRRHFFRPTAVNWTIQQTEVESALYCNNRIPSVGFFSEALSLFRQKIITMKCKMIHMEFTWTELN